VDNQQQEIIQSTQQQPTIHIAPSISNPLKGEGLTFENDFGKKPLFLAHLTKDQGMIAVLSLAGAFVGAALAGVPMALVMIAAGLSDIRYAARDSNTTDSEPAEKPQLEQVPIEVPVQTVVENESEPAQESNSFNEQVPTESQSASPKVTQTGVVLREDPGFSQDLIALLARSPLSKIFGAVPGSGKTTMQRALIKEVAIQFPLSQFYITQTKRDPFLGIESIPGVVVFSAPRRDNGEPILDQADRVSKILEYRSSFKACQAKRLFKDKPVILLLCDYSDSLQQCSSEVKTELVKIIQQIRFNGRALNVQVWLDVQVLNQLEALGLTGSDSRSSGIILTLGAERVEEGGDFGVVENAIFGSSETFPSGFKAKLKPHLETFKARSRETNRTLVITPFMDANAFLLPDWSALEDEKLPDSVLLQLERNDQQQKNELSSKHQRESLPNSVPPLPNKSNSDSDSSKVAATTDSEADGQRSIEVGDFKISDELAEPLKSIWLFAKKKKNWVTVKDVYKNELAALKGKNVKQIRQYLGLLADTGYGEIDELDKDKPKSDSAVGFRAY
jgi:hypothetical protein